MTVYSEIKTLIEEIKKHDNITLAGHIAPDGDAIASSLALALAIKNMGKTPIIILEEHNGYKYLKGLEMIYYGDYKDIKTDMFISLDCGSMARLGKLEDMFKRAKKTANIDHHITNNSFGDINIVNKNASSTSEIVYEIIDEMGSLDKDMANAIYTGIVFDTSGFKHKSSTKRTYEIASKLVEKGADNSFIHTELLYKHTFENARLLAKAIQNIEVDGSTIITTLTKDEIINKCSADYKDLEGISGYMLDFKDIDTAIFLYEKNDGSIKISFRAKELNVNKIACKYNGGGHILASGANIDMDIEDAKKLMLEEVRKAKLNRI